MVVEIITPKVLFIPALLSPPGRGGVTMNCVEILRGKAKPVRI